MSRYQSSIPLGMVLIRVMTGGVLALQGWDWLGGESLAGGTIRRVIADAGPGLSSISSWWGERVLLANPDATALFWRWGTFLIGIAFISGGLVRVAGLLAATLIAHGLVFGAQEDARIFLLLAASVIACAGSDAGRRLGMDSFLADQLPAWLTLRKKRRSTFLG